MKTLLDKQEKFVFIDCRLPNEYAITKIDGATLIPLQQLAARFGELKGHEKRKSDRALPQRRAVAAVRKTAEAETDSKT